MCCELYGKILFLGIFERVQSRFRVLALGSAVEGKILLLVILERAQYLFSVWAVLLKERFSSLGCLLLL